MSGKIWLVNSSMKAAVGAGGVLTLIRSSSTLCEETLLEKVGKVFAKNICTLHEESTIYCVFTNGEEWGGEEL